MDKSDALKSEEKIFEALDSKFFINKSTLLQGYL